MSFCHWKGVVNEGVVRARRYGSSLRATGAIGGLLHSVAHACAWGMALTLGHGRFANAVSVEYSRRSGPRRDALRNGCCNGTECAWQRDVEQGAGL